VDVCGAFCSPHTFMVQCLSTETALPFIVALAILTCYDKCKQCSTEIKFRSLYFWMWQWYIIAAYIFFHERQKKKESKICCTIFYHMWVLSPFFLYRLKFLYSSQKSVSADQFLCRNKADASSCFICMH
jgi:hypothetical protein